MISTLRRGRAARRAGACSSSPARSTTTWSARRAGRSSAGCSKGGVQIYEYRPALLHAKTMVIDGIWATVGSTNLDHRSFSLNEEVNVVDLRRDTVASRLRAGLRGGSRPTRAG